MSQSLVATAEAPDRKKSHQTLKPNIPRPPKRLAGQPSGGLATTTVSPMRLRPHHSEEKFPKKVKTQVLPSTLLLENAKKVLSRHKSPAAATAAAATTEEGSSPDKGNRTQIGFIPIAEKVRLSLQVQFQKQKMMAKRIARQAKLKQEFEDK